MDNHNKCEECCQGTDKGACGGCYHGFCGGHHGGLRWIIGIIIVVIVFVMGVKLGELKSVLGYSDGGYYGGYGYPMMYRYGGMMGNWNGAYGPNMMYQLQTAPTTSTSKTAK